MPAIRLRAFAKINLALRIHRRRVDGFHDLHTIFQSIELHDRVTIESRRGPFEIRGHTPGLPLDRSNLIWKAAERLWAADGRSGEPNGVAITLDKHIPMQAGLGGGSSDAAAALIGLRRAWKMKLGPADLRAVAATIGSDVPFFLIGGTVLGLGRGEQLYPLEDLPPLWTLLATPSFGIGTADAYTWWDAARSTGEVRQLPTVNKEIRSVFPTWLALEPLVNDFESVVFERHEVLADLKAQLLAAGAAMAAVSGSGSTVFGVFATRRAADGAAARLKGRLVRAGLRAALILTRFRRRGGS